MDPLPSMASLSLTGYNRANSSGAYATGQTDDASGIEECKGTLAGTAPLGKNVPNEFKPSSKGLLPMIRGIASVHGLQATEEMCLHIMQVVDERYWLATTPVAKALYLDAASSFGSATSPSTPPTRRRGPRSGKLPPKVAALGMTRQQIYKKLRFRTGDLIKSKADLLRRSLSHSESASAAGLLRSTDKLKGPLGCVDKFVLSGSGPSKTYTRTVVGYLTCTVQGHVNVREGRKPRSYVVCGVGAHPRGLSIRTVYELFDPDGECIGTRFYSRDFFTFPGRCPAKWHTHTYGGIEFYILSKTVRALPKPTHPLRCYDYYMSKLDAVRRVSHDEALSVISLDYRFEGTNCWSLCNSDGHVRIRVNGSFYTLGDGFGGLEYCPIRFSTLERSPRLCTSKNCYEPYGLGSITAHLFEYEIDEDCAPARLSALLRRFISSSRNRAKAVQDACTLYFALRSSSVGYFNDVCDEADDRPACDRNLESGHICLSCMRKLEFVTSIRLRYGINLRDFGPKDERIPPSSRFVLRTGRRTCSSPRSSTEELIRSLDGKNIFGERLVGTCGGVSITDHSISRFLEADVVPLSAEFFESGDPNCKLKRLVYANGSFVVLFMSQEGRIFKAIHKRAHAVATELLADTLSEGFKLPKDVLTSVTVYPFRSNRSRCACNSNVTHAHCHGARIFSRMRYLEAKELGFISMDNVLRAEPMDADHVHVPHGKVSLPWIQERAPSPFTSCCVRVAKLIISVFTAFKCPLLSPHDPVDSYSEISDVASRVYDYALDNGYVYCEGCESVHLPDVHDSIMHVPIYDLELGAGTSQITVQGAIYRCRRSPDGLCYFIALESNRVLHADLYKIMCPMCGGSHDLSSCDKAFPHLTT